MTTCARCGKQNQDQYRFCLGCGAKLEAAPKAAAGELGTAKTDPPPDLAAMAMPKPRTAVPPQGAAARPDVAAAPGRAGTAAPQTAAPVPAAGATPCPQCGKPVAAGYAFCGACGHRMKPAAAPAPQAAPAAEVPRTMFLAGPAPTASKAAPRGHLTLIRPDGSDGEMHPLQEGDNLMGRGQGAVFDADPYLSPRHAEFVLSDEGLIVRDLRSLNGVFVRITQEEPLEHADVFRIGQELLRFDVIAPPAPLEDGTELVGTPNPGYWGRISVIVGRDMDGLAFPIFDEAVVLGRERGDIVFPEDGYVSGTHAQVTLRDGRVYLSDLGSSNGTFIRIRGSRALPSGSLILMGQQLFRVTYR